MKTPKKTKKVSVKKTTSKKTTAKKSTKKTSTVKKVVKPKVAKPKATKKKVKEKAVLDVNSKDPEVLLGDRNHPRGWKAMTYEQKLDYIASRIIAEDRHGITSHKELKESGILSTSQYERRRNREVYSQVGDLDAIKVKPGVFSRTHIRDIRGVRNTSENRTEEIVDE